MLFLMNYNNILIKYALLSLLLASTLVIGGSCGVLTIIEFPA